MGEEIWCESNYPWLISDNSEIIKPIAALLSDVDQGPFRLLIIDSIIGKTIYELLSTSHLIKNMQLFFEWSFRGEESCLNGSKRHGHP